MIKHCPICQSQEPTSVWRRERSPILQLIPAGSEPPADGFATLDIVRCGRCGHLFNQAFDEAILERMYGSDVLSNVPVSQAMSARLQATAEWIGPGLYRGRKVLEIGGGSLGLARILAREALAVRVFEPSAGNSQGDLPETNVELVRAMFPLDDTPMEADLIICRQVLEHTALPGLMLEKIRSSLSPGGQAYVEVPNLDYIEDHAALFDFHNAHIQYFNFTNLMRLAGALGLYPTRRWESLDGRDFGVLFSLDRHGTVPPPRPGACRQGAGERYQSRHDAFTRFFRSTASGMALYGATWTGLAFLNAFLEPPRFQCVLDDNPGYAGLALYHPDTQVAVQAPDPERLHRAESILITAYNHAPAITRRLRELGFQGVILDVGSDPPQRAGGSV